jgi:hypothetical protein
MNGGTISNNTNRIEISDATFTMNNGTITRTHQEAISVTDGGKFTMKNGEITNNKGDGVFTDGATFIMDGGLISRNERGVTAGYQSSFTMSGGTISRNAPNCGVMVYGASFTMTGGTIASNEMDGQGGGVSMSGADCTFVKTGQSIIYGINGGDNANIAKSRGHAAISPDGKRDATAGPGVNMRWSQSGAKEGWEL